MTAPHYEDGPVTVWEGDCIEVMSGLPADSVDAVVTDPPYGLEFLGREWDRFRIDDPGTSRHRGERAGAHGTATRGDDRSTPFKRGDVAYGGGRRPTTNVCTGCGKRDQFRNPHDCPEGTAWQTILLHPDAAPPSSLAFQEWTRRWAREAYRVLKPGGHLLAFGGTRTFHRLTSGIEDAGFDIRDAIGHGGHETPALLAWVYGSGFPKSVDVGKAIDRVHGAEREVTREATAAKRVGETIPWDVRASTDRERRDRPATEDGQRWDGWGTALKPAWEPIVVARKPLAGTVAANVLAYGTGALNLDATRLGYVDDADREQATVPQPRWGGGVFDGSDGRNGETFDPSKGRWPANVVLDHAPGCVPAGTVTEQVGGGAFGVSGFAAGYDGEQLSRGIVSTVWECVPGCPVATIDAQSGETPGGAFPGVQRAQPGAANGTMGGGWSGAVAPARRLEGGGASRFFYTAKAPGSERPTVDGVAHPTVKPLSVMRWLVRLVTPPGGTVLEPFAGSGTTVEAAVLEGFRCIAIEREATYLPLIVKRIRKPHAVGLDLDGWEPDPHPTPVRPRQGPSAPAPVSVPPDTVAATTPVGFDFGEWEA